MQVSASLITRKDLRSDSHFVDDGEGTSLAAPLVSGIAYAITTEGDSLAPENMRRIFVGDVIAGLPPAPQRER